MRRFDKARVLAAVEIKLKMMSMKSAAPVPPNTPPFPLFDAVHADIIADLVIANALKHPEQMSVEETWADYGDFVDWQAPQVCGVPVATRRGMISPPKSGHGASPGKARGMNGELLTGTATGSVHQIAGTARFSAPTGTGDGQGRQGERRRRRPVALAGPWRRWPRSAVRAWWRR